LFAAELLLPQVLEMALILWWNVAEFPIDIAPISLESPHPIQLVIQSLARLLHRKFPRAPYLQIARAAFSYLLAISNSCALPVTFSQYPMPKIVLCKAIRASVDFSPYSPTSVAFFSVAWARICTQHSFHKLQNLSLARR
jgi:hypothetical protein